MLDVGELFRLSQRIQEPGSVFDVPAEVADSGVKNILEAELPHEVVGQDSNCFDEDIVGFGPQVPQISYGVNPPPLALHKEHEVRVGDLGEVV